MTGYTWIGGSANWTAARYWTVAGAATTSFPGPGDDALIAAPGTYTVVLDGGTLSPQTIDSVALTDLGATLRITQHLLVTGSVSNAGSIIFALSGYPYYPDSSIEIDGGFANAGSATVSTGMVEVLGTFSNSGNLTVASGAGLQLTSLTTASLAGVTVNGTLLVTGTLDNRGAVLSTSTLANLALDGTVLGGVVRFDGTLGSLGGTLDGVTLQGEYNLGPNDQVLYVRDGLTVQSLDGAAGTLDISAPGIGGAYLQFLDAETLDNMTVNIAGIQSEAPQIFTLTTLTLGSQATLSASTPQSNFRQATVTGLDIVSYGTITNTGTLLLNPYAFDNEGLLATGQDGRTAVGRSGDTLVNGGVVLANNGSVYIQGNLAGAGLIALSVGSTIELTAGYDRQVFDFLDATANVLKLDAPIGTNTVLNFVPGSTIELVGTPASVATSDGTVTASAGTYALASFFMSGAPAGASFQAVVDANNNTFITETIACFAGGTRIRKLAGDVAVEDLRPGDLLPGADGPQPVVWIGRRHLDLRRHRRREAAWPVRIKAHALSPGVPMRDLWLSPEHAVLIDDLLIPAKLLVNGASIAQVPRPSITYWHVELPRHGIVLAEGLPTESYLDTGNRADFENGGPALSLHPEFADAIWRAEAFAPQLRDGPRLAAIRERLVRRAVRLGFFYAAASAAL